MESIKNDAFPAGKCIFAANVKLINILSIKPLIELEILFYM